MTLMLIKRSKKLNLIKKVDLFCHFLSLFWLNLNKFNLFLIDFQLFDYFWSLFVIHFILTSKNLALNFLALNLDPPSLLQTRHSKITRLIFNFKNCWTCTIYNSLLYFVHIVGTGPLKLVVTECVNSSTAHSTLAKLRHVARQDFLNPLQTFLTSWKISFLNQFLNMAYNLYGHKKYVLYFGPTRFIILPLTKQVGYP